MNLASLRCHAGYLKYLKDCEQLCVCNNEMYEMAHWPEDAQNISGDPGLLLYPSEEECDFEEFSRLRASTSSRSVGKSNADEDVLSSTCQDQGSAVVSSAKGSTLSRFAASSTDGNSIQVANIIAFPAILFGDKFHRSCLQYWRMCIADRSRAPANHT